jgi:hypothetical protein
MKITLPKGHEWREQPSASSNETLFICKDCGASFTHDMIDNSTNFEPGYGDCEDGEEPEQEIA